MKDNKDFPTGLYHNQRDKAPDFVKANIGIQRDRFIEWLKGQDENVSIDLLVSRDGKPYAKINDYKPKEGAKEPASVNNLPDDSESDLPF